MSGMPSAKACALTGLSSPALWARDQLTIVTFHRVLPPTMLAGYPLPAIAVTPEELDYFVGVFQKHYTVGSLHAMMQLQASGSHAGKPLLAITFDDGQIDNYLFARSVLQSREVRASFFVVSAAADDGEPLWHDRMAFAIHHALAQESAGSGPLAEGPWHQRHGKPIQSHWRSRLPRR